MCCAINTDDVFKNTTFADLVSTLQNGSLAKKSKVSASVGRRDGLRLILDLHSNEASFGTMTDIANAFNIFIGSSTEFPVQHLLVLDTCSL